MINKDKSDTEGVLDEDAIENLNNTHVTAQESETEPDLDVYLGDGQWGNSRHFEH